MTQTDQNTPATVTTSKRVTKAKTTAAKAAADTEVLAPVETEQSPSLDAVVNQEKTSSQAELQGEGQTPVADIELEQGTSKEIDDVKAQLLTVEQPQLLDTAVNQEKTSSQAELQGMQSDTAGQNLIADVEPEQATDKDVDAIKSDSEPENGNQEISVTANTESNSAEISASQVNEPVGTEQVLFGDQSAQYQSVADAVQVGEKNDVVLTDEASSVELINEVLPEVQIPSPVKHVTVAKTGLFVVVKNTGVQTVFEPLSKTLIKSGETVEIRCSTGQFKHDVLNNLKQFIGLGKNLEIQNA